ncbi:MAG TPA: photosynthetic complex assembly protein PuhC [Methylobacterium sp.]|jgi:putative photosynthetic complex assembly protein|uniref:photosynthetic complex assembly protein PuhC n=1 Tax=Methylorubrum sp. B1-46 TaxID=2897334 RepID=UPI001E50E234|nr:photosynthetic complex assembly protein PuhC [Methylorubrum sp. B1-46]UGB25978.1 photosynthetic complex assembly protein [Methylorubrum sp. B1-46]HEV2543074.1 photosynthetic complex assembly protein PuhC [Methylobacterium sp.]
MPVELNFRRQPEKPPSQRPALLAVAALLGVALTAVALGRGQEPVPEERPARPIQTLAFHAEDQPDGAIDLRSAERGTLVARIEPGQDGFIRGTLRGLAQARQREGQSREPPFTLTRFDNGTLSLEDGATGRQVPLLAFGPSNAKAFARLLPGTELR